MQCGTRRNHRACGVEIVVRRDTTTLDQVGAVVGKMLNTEVEAAIVVVVDVTPGQQADIEDRRYMQHVVALATSEQLLGYLVVAQQNPHQAAVVGATGDNSETVGISPH